MLGFRPLAADPLAAGARAAAAAEPEPQPEPAAQPQPAGGVYAPPRRDPNFRRRISFLQEDIRERYERAREAKLAIEAVEGRLRETPQTEITRGDIAAQRGLERSAARLEEMLAAIAVLETELAQLIRLQQFEDEEDALAVILAATLH